MAAFGFTACLSGGAQRDPDAARPEPSAPATSPSARRANAMVQIERAKQLARDGKIGQAVPAAEAAVAADPNSEDAYLLLASLCSMNDQQDCLDRAYARGLKALPNSAALLHARGMSALERSDLPSSVADLERAHELSMGQDAEIEADLAYSYLFVDRVADAEQIARTAHKLNPKSYAAAFTLGEALLREKRWKDAATAYREALAVHEDPAARRRLGLVLSESGQLEEALATYEGLLGSRDQAADPSLHVAIASVLMRLNRRPQAIEQIKTAVQLDPDEPKYRALLKRAEEEAAAPPPRKKGKSR